MRRVPLSQLQPGQSAKITAVPNIRLTEIGLIPGTNVKLIAKGPFKTPLHISFHSCELLIDRHTAEFVEVELCGYF